VKERDFKIGRSNIWNLLRNPIYYGKIFLPAYKDEPAMLVKGIHEPLISEQLFFETQDVLEGRKRKVPSKHTARVELPLRGFLKCRKCGANLTGSSSKGNGGKYFYYHCNIRCKERIPAELANEIFVEELRTISSNEESILLFEEIVKDYTKQSGKDKSKVIRDLQTEIEKNRQRISNAQQLMLDGELPAADYREIKNRYDPEIQKLVNKQLSLAQLDDNLAGFISPVIDLLRNLPEYYLNATLNTKQKIIGSIFPEKMIFENKTYRTTTLNEVIALICRTGKGSGGNKKGQAFISENLSKEVIPLGLEPRAPTLKVLCSTN
jgi:site-specific DNA recombinase